MKTNTTVASLALPKPLPKFGMPFTLFSDITPQATEWLWLGQIISRANRRSRCYQPASSGGCSG